MQENAQSFDSEQEYVFQNYLYGLEGRPVDFSNHEASSEGSTQNVQRHYGPQWALLEFDQPVTAPKVYALASCTPKSTFPACQCCK